MALHEQEDLESQGQMLPRVTSVPPVPLPTEIPAPTKASNTSKRKRTPTAENEAQSIAPVEEEEAPPRPVKRARTGVLKVRLQPPTPKVSFTRRTLTEATPSLRRIAPCSAPEASPGPSATSAPATDCRKSATKNCNPKPKSKQVSSLSPFKVKQMRTLKTVEEMVEHFERREKRAEDWAKQYREIGRSIRPQYDFWKKEQLEWIMSAAIQYQNNWDKITLGYQKVFPEAEPRTKHSIYSKWARQWEREEKLRQNDPSKISNRPGHDKMAPPMKKKTPEDKRRMIEKALEIVRSKQKS
ncbi:hypothetical protein EV426DRAFT_707993 [Tirmania nivea]|nr:hypothetical protein EV426DRAFT_707993 [Tirmania nivea]